MILSLIPNFEFNLQMPITVPKLQCQTAPKYLWKVLPNQDSTTIDSCLRQCPLHFAHIHEMLASPLKRRRSSTPSSLSRTHKTPRTSTVVIAGNISNGARFLMNGGPSSIGPNDIYKATSQVLGASNNHDFSELRWCETEGGKTIYLATVNEAGRENWSTRKRGNTLTVDEWRAPFPLT